MGEVGWGREEVGWGYQKASCSQWYLRWAGEVERDLQSISMSVSIFREPMVIFESPIIWELHKWSSRFLGEQLIEIKLKGKKILGWAGGWGSIENLPSLSKTVGGLLQDLGPRTTWPEWYFRAFHQRVQTGWLRDRVIHQLSTEELTGSLTRQSRQPWKKGRIQCKRLCEGLTLAMNWPWQVKEERAEISLSEHTALP